MSIIIVFAAIFNGRNIIAIVRVIEHLSPWQSNFVQTFHAMLWRMSYYIKGP